MRLSHLAVVLLSLAWVGGAVAVEVPPQRGSACGAVWGIGAASAIPGKSSKRPWQLTCVDGDPRCDRDGSVNDRCSVALDACIGTAAGCPGDAVRTVRVARKTRRAIAGLEPPAANTTSGCGATGSISVAVGTTSDALSLRSRTRNGRSSNRLRVRCLGIGECPECCTFGSDCRREAPGLPRLATLTVSSAGSDLDFGISGDAHNFAIPTGAELGFCLSGCDGSSDFVCDATSSCASFAGAMVGAPVPMSYNSIPICVVTRRAATSAVGTIDLDTGAMSVPVAVDAEVYVQTADTNADNVCPRCTGEALGARGTCTAGEDMGQRCTVDGVLDTVAFSGGSPTYFLSRDCRPDARKLARVVPLALTLTTGEVTASGSLPCPGQTQDAACGSGACNVDCSDLAVPSKGGVNQTCCSNNPRKPCFPTAPDSLGAIVRSGVASTGDGAVLAGVFCLPATDDANLNIFAGLPGPAAILLPVRLDVDVQP